MLKLKLVRYIDSPIIWAAAGFAIGSAAGLTTLSASLLVVALVFYIPYIILHGRPRLDFEGKLVFAVPLLITAFLPGLLVNAAVY